MSVFEEIAKRYFDEVGVLVPASSALSFLFGVCFFAIDAKSGAGWVGLMGTKFSSIWFFGDLIFELQVSALVLIAALSLLGPVLSRVVALRFMVRGVSANEVEIRRVFDLAKKLAPAGVDSIYIEAARNLRKMSSTAVWGQYRIASLLFSISLISIFSFSLVGLTVGLFMIGAGIFLAFRFAVSFVASYLPERILIDAALGLIEPRILESAFSESK